MRTKPVYLNLFTIAFPITAIVSILHRLSGLLLFFCIPFVLIILQSALFSRESFNQLKEQFIHSLCAKTILWVSLTAFMYHFFAGIRHVLMDAGLAESKSAARQSSYLIFVLSFIAAVIIGYKIW